MRLAGRWLFTIPVVVLIAGSAASAQPKPASPSAPADAAGLDALIAQNPTDDRTPSWLVDRAIAELATLSADGADTSLMFGIASADQRRRGLEAARRAIALLDDAAVRAEAAVKRLEDGVMGRDGAEPDAARRAAAAESALTRLVDVEQAQRMPFYRAAAQTILASALDGAPRTDAARAAITALSRLSFATPGAEASRRVTLIAALLNSGGLDEQVRDTVAAELRWFDAAPADAPADPLTQTRVAMVRRTLEAGAGATPGPISGLQQAEAVARGLLLPTRVHPEQRTQLTAAACKVLLSAAPPGADPSARLTLYAKIAAIIEPGVDTGMLPAEAGLARAVSLLRENVDSLEARALLAQLAQRSDVTGPLRATVLWETAAIYTRVAESDADVRAVDSLDRFISEFPDDERAPAAARSLEGIAGRLARGSDLAPDRRAQLERIQLRALDLLIAHPNDFPGQLGEWKARSIAIRVRPLDPATLTPEQLAPLVELDGTIDRPRPSVASVALADLYRRIIDDPGWSERPAVQRIAMVDLIRRSRDTIDESRLPLLSGEAKLAAGRPDAADELRPLIGGPLDQPEQPTRARLRLALAAALKADPARRAEALTLLRQLTAPLDEATSSSPRPEHYWQAWALSLELLQLDNADGARSDSIRAQAKRLELLDSTLGGPATAERIRRARDAAAAK
jgi:hypothetical protein